MTTTEINNLNWVNLPNKLKVFFKSILTSLTSLGSRITELEDNSGGATPQKQIILFITQTGTDAPIFIIKENTSDIPNVDITSDIVVDLPNNLRPRIILGGQSISITDIKEINFTNINDTFDVENQIIKSVSIKEFTDNAISFNSTTQDVLNTTLTNEGGILEGFLTIKFI